jgi:hypothetical protein
MKLLIILLTYTTCFGIHIVQHFLRKAGKLGGFIQPNLLMVGLLPRFLVLLIVLFCFLSLGVLSLASFASCMSFSLHLTLFVSLQLIPKSWSHGGTRVSNHLRLLWFFAAFCFLFTWELGMG